MTRLEQLCRDLGELETRVIERMRAMGRADDELEVVAKRLLVRAATHGPLTPPTPEDRIMWREEALSGFVLATMATVIADL